LEGKYDAMNRKIPGWHIFLAALFLVIPGRSYSQGSPQTNCTNSNFSFGTFWNWTGCYGNWSYPCQTIGMDTSGTYPSMVVYSDVNATDPNTCGNLHKVCPGESHSARLGRDNYGSGISNATLKYTIVVNTQPYYFKYSYAMVLANAGHPANQAPNFSIQVTDTANNIVDPVHGNVYFYANMIMPGWGQCYNAGPTYWYKDWVSDSVDLSSYLGQTITATFQSRYCSFNNHPGYAYIDAYCICPVTRTWTGAVNGQWNNPANWSPSGIPTYLDTVVIPYGVTTMPVVNVSGMTCTTLHIANGATVTISPGVKLNVTGDVILEGEP
jgi:hypothetical protein